MQSRPRMQVLAWSFTFMGGIWPPFCGPFPSPGGDGGVHDAGGDSPVDDAGTDGLNDDAADVAPEVGGDFGVWIEEPLLGCRSAPLSRPAPDSFELFDIPDYISPETGEAIPFAPHDWSGNGEYLGGVLSTLDPADEFYSRTVARWSPARGFEIATPAVVDRGIGVSMHIDCSGDVLAGHLPDRSIYRWAGGQLQLRGDDGWTRTDPVLSEDGATLIWNETHDGSPFVYPIVWSQSGRGGGSDVLRGSELFDLSYDAGVLFGQGASCEVSNDCPTTVYRIVGEGPREWLVGAPVTDVSADGVTFVTSGGPGQLALWRDTGIQTISCPAAPCGVVQQSSRARILLVQVAGAPMVWTERHGFRPLTSLFAAPEGWVLDPNDMSSDGRVFIGTATRGGSSRTFRAVVRSGAYE